MSPEAVSHFRRGREGPSIQRGRRQKKAQESTVKRSATRNLEAKGIRSKQRLREGVGKVNSDSHFVCTSCQDGRERQSTRFHTETGNFHSRTIKTPVAPLESGTIPFLLSVCRESTLFYLYEHFFSALSQDEP